MSNRHQQKWYPIPSAPGYFANEDGTILGKMGRVLNPPAHEGYRRIRVRQPDGKRKSLFVHCLVCEAFHGLRPLGHEAAHNDGDSLNNKPDNLRWATHKENIADRKRHGRWMDGEKNNFSKLSYADVSAIKSSSQQTHVLAKQYAVAGSHIRRIRSGKAWAIANSDGSPS